MFFSGTEMVVDASSGGIGNPAVVNPVGLQNDNSDGNREVVNPIDRTVGIPNDNSDNNLPLNPELQQRIQGLAASLELPQSLATNVAPTAQSAVATVAITPALATMPATTLIQTPDQSQSKLIFSTPSSVSLVRRHSMDLSMIPSGSRSSQIENRRVSCMILIL